MGDFEKKLRAMHEKYSEDGGRSDFNGWMILHAEATKTQLVIMAGDLGQAMGKISDLRQILLQIRSFVNTEIEE